MVLRQLFAANPGDARLLFHIQNNGREEQVPARLRIEISQKLIEEARAVAKRVGGEVRAD